MTDLRTWWRYGDRIAFRCPGCERVHEVTVAGPGAWGWNESQDALTLTPSVHVSTPTRKQTDICHSFVKGGMIKFLGDCTHTLRGKTVALPRFGSPYAGWPSADDGAVT